MMKPESGLHEEFRIYLLRNERYPLRGFPGGLYGRQADFQMSDTRACRAYYIHRTSP